MKLLHVFPHLVILIQDVAEFELLENKADGRFCDQLHSFPPWPCHFCVLLPLFVLCSSVMFLSIQFPASLFSPFCFSAISWSPSFLPGAFKSIQLAILWCTCVSIFMWYYLTQPKLYPWVDFPKVQCEGDMYPWSPGLEGGCVPWVLVQPELQSLLVSNKRLGSAKPLVSFQLRTFICTSELSWLSCPKSQITISSLCFYVKLASSEMEQC